MFKKTKAIDYKLFFAVLSLMIFGMIMISSVSVYSSFRVTDLMARRGTIEEAYNYFYVIRNIMHILISFVILGLVAKTPYKLFQKYSKHIFGVVLFLLVFVLIKGVSLKGASGWINIPGVPFTIQPTEFLKFSLIIFLAAFFGLKNFLGDLLNTIFSVIGIISLGLLLIVGLGFLFYLSIPFGLIFVFISWYFLLIFIKKKKYNLLFKSSFLPFFGIISSASFLVGLQPDFGTLMVILPVSVIMFFISGANVKYLAILGVLGVVLSTSIYSAGKYDKNITGDRNSLSYITDRIDNFLEDNKTAIKSKTINYQTEQGLIAIGSGGFFGLGFGESIQKFGYLPEVQGDFIFSVVVEELGFFGAFVLVFIYLYIGYRGFYIASRVDDLFAKYSAIGISSWILIQAFINIGVNLNIVPLTGITLPFISYGGSSLLSLAIAIGFLLSVSRHMEEKAKYARISKGNNIFNFRFK